MMAKERYDQLRKEIELNLELFKMKLDKHQQSFNSDDGNWGYVGDISAYNERLKEILGV
jgi:hypothetical protein